jgi:hypothetical protein
METRLVVVLTILTPLLITCGGGGGDGDGTDDNILHLREVDITEAEAKLVFVELFEQEPQAKAFICDIAAAGREAFVEGIRMGDEVSANQGAMPTTGTPRPGQRAEPASHERLYTIVKELCTD